MRRRAENPQISGFSGGVHCIDIRAALMVAFNVVLRYGAVVLDALLRQEVCGVGLLKQRVTHILLVSENLVDGACVPFFFSCAG